MRMQVAPEKRRKSRALDDRSISIGGPSTWDRKPPVPRRFEIVTMKAERETKPRPPLLLEQNLALNHILLKDEPCHISWSPIPRFTLRLLTPTLHLVLHVPMAATVSGWTPSSDDEIVSLHPALEPLDEYPAHWTTSVFKRTPSHRHTTRPAPPRAFTMDSPISDCYPSPTSSYSPSPPSPPQTRIPPPLTSSERRAIRNRLRDPNWIPRPRNAFIIFRCEYAREHARYAPGEPTRIITDKTLSKRAGDAWKKLSAAQRAIFKKRADVERQEHARQYPAYRFNPTRPTARSRSKSSPVPAPGVGRSAQVASLVEEKASTPRLVEAEPTSPGYLVERQVPNLLGHRRPSSTPLPSSLAPIDNSLAPGLSSSYPNTPYIQTYQPADGMFVQNVGLFSGYTFDSGNPVVSTSALLV